MRPFLIALSLSVSVAMAFGSSGLAAPATSSPRLFADDKVFTAGRISVEVVGQGPDLVLIPGLASSRETWKAAAERLKDHYRLHLVQVAGFAGEPARDNAAGPVLEPTAEAIDAYIRDQGLAPATVIGHSLGGTMILWLAIHHPQDLRRALVVDALPDFAQVMLGANAPPEQVKAMAEGMRRAPPLPASANEKMLAAMVGGADNRALVAAWSQASNPSAVQNALADDLELDLRPDLGRIHTPITLLYPDNTPVGAPPGAMDGFYKTAFAQAPTIKLERVDKSLHFIMLDQPAAFSEALDAFLAGR